MYKRTQLEYKHTIKLMTRVFLIKSLNADTYFKET